MIRLILFKVTLKLKLQTSNFTQRLHIEVNLIQFETCQTYHFQDTGENMGY